MKKVISLTAALVLCLGLLCVPAGAATKVEESPEALRNGKTKQITGVYGQYILLQEDGSLWTWGSPFYDKEGVAENGEPMWQGHPVQIMSDVIYMEDALAGNFMVVKRDGSVWRLNFNGKPEKCLNAGTGAVAAVHGFYGENASLQEALEKGLRSDVFVLKENGDLSAYPYYDGAEKSALEPEVPILKDVAKLCSIGAIKKDGSLWTWGKDGNDNSAAITPRKMMDDVKDTIYSAKGINWVVKTDGSLWGWGSLPQGRVEAPTRMDIEGVRRVQAFDQFVFLPDVAILENGGFAVMGRGGKWAVAKDVRALQELAVSQKENFCAPVVLLDGNGCVWSLDMAYVNSSIDDSHGI